MQFACRIGRTPKAVGHSLIDKTLQTDNSRHRVPSFVRFGLALPKRGTGGCGQPSICHRVNGQNGVALLPPEYKKLSETAVRRPEPQLDAWTIATKDSHPKQPEYNMSRYNAYSESMHAWTPSAHHPTQEMLWKTLRREAAAASASEPIMASWLHSAVLAHDCLSSCLSFLLANKLHSNTLLGTQLMHLMQQAFHEDPDIVDDCMADILSIKDRDPACKEYLQPLMFFKGFHAASCYRIAHWSWRKGRKSLAHALQSRISEVFHVDIHPAAQVGRGVMIDHATGVVIGETAVIGDNVTMMHHVTLGGSGSHKGIRHPFIGHGSVLGAGATVLGPVLVGSGTKIGAGSLVVSDLPPNCVAVGVPVRIVKRHLSQQATAAIDQGVDYYILDYEI